MDGQYSKFDGYIKFEEESSHEVYSNPSSIFWLYHYSFRAKYHARSERYVDQVSFEIASENASIYAIINSEYRLHLSLN